MNSEITITHEHRIYAGLRSLAKLPYFEQAD